MPRTHRIEFPGRLVHIMSRGIDGMSIFREDADRLYFLRKLESGLQRTGYRCLAWALMDNHYHLLLRMSDLPMSKLMRSLNGAYGRYFNKKYGRTGYLYQDRFRSVVCQDQEYAKELIRYIHLNPLRAGLVDSLSALRTWKWCGHGFLLGEPPMLALQEQDEVIRRFARIRSVGVAHYLSYLQEGLDTEDPYAAGWLSDTSAEAHDKSGKGLPSVIGDPSFVRDAMEKNSKRLSLLRKLRESPEALEELADSICKAHGITREMLRRSGRNNARSAARKEFCIRAYSELQASTTAIAHILNVTLAPVSTMISRWELEK